MRTLSLREIESLTQGSNQLGSTVTMGFGGDQLEEMRLEMCPRQVLHAGGAA